MENLNEILDKMEKLIRDARNELENHEEDIREEVISNIEDIISDFGDCDDLREYMNDNFDVDIHEMNESEFNETCVEKGLTPWEIADWNVDKGANFFGVDEYGDVIFNDYLEEFVSYRKVAEEMVKYEEDLGNDAIRAELEKLHNSEKVYEEFMEAIKKLLGVKELPKEVIINETTNI